MKAFALFGAPGAIGRSTAEELRRRGAARDVQTLIYLVGVPYNRFDMHPAGRQRPLCGIVGLAVTRAGILWFDV